MLPSAAMMAFLMPGPAGSVRGGLLFDDPPPRAAGERREGPVGGRPDVREPEVAERAISTFCGLSGVLLGAADPGWNFIMSQPGKLALVRRLSSADMPTAGEAVTLLLRCCP